MSERMSDERLNDYVDGLLGESDAAEVERALAASAEARATVDFLRSLRAAAAELPESIEPARDLWPDIEARMAPAPLMSVESAAARASSAAQRASAAWWPSMTSFQWATLGAAAMLLIVVSSGLTAWLVVGAGGDAAGAGPQAIPAATPADTEIRPGEAAYALEIEQLMRTLYENRDSLDPDTISTIETNLRVIDRAIDRAREALEEDPANAGLTRMLTNNYEHKLNLLQRANRIIEMS